MATRTLAEIDIRPCDGRFTLRLAIAGGETIEIETTRDQLDHLADLLDDALLGEDEAE